MKIEYNTNALRLVVDDEERVKWLDGQKLYYALPKDYRPDINPYDVEDCQQIYYKLYGITKDNFGLNQVPPELIESLNNLSKLTEILTDYSNHVLGLISQAQGTDLPTEDSKAASSDTDAQSGAGEKGRL